MKDQHKISSLHNKSRELLISIRQMHPITLHFILSEYTFLFINKDLKNIRKVYFGNPCNKVDLLLCPSLLEHCLC